MLFSFELFPEGPLEDSGVKPEHFHISLLCCWPIQVLAAPPKRGTYSGLTRLTQSGYQQGQSQGIGPDEAPGLRENLLTNAFIFGKQLITALLFLG